MKKALITGLTGQDGAFLADLLLSKNYDVYGTYRRISSPNFWRLKYLGIENEVNLIPCDVSDSAAVMATVRKIRPDEVYHLAAQSYVFASFDSPVSTLSNNGISTVNFLETLRSEEMKDTTFYNAATSEMFGNNDASISSETSAMSPESPYACSKLYSFHMTRLYRDAHDIKAYNGILFNHESELRGLEFVTRKISNEVAKIHLGISNQLKIGTISTRRDWGFAPEYVNAMYLMMQSAEPDDYVVATGNSHTVQEFLELAFGEVDLNWKRHTIVDKSFVRKHDVNHLRGDYSKIHRKLGWEPRMNFESLVKLMVSADINRWQKIQSGELVPTDALFYEESLHKVHSISGIYA